MQQPKIKQSDKTEEHIRKAINQYCEQTLNCSRDSTSKVL